MKYLIILIIISIFATDNLGQSKYIPFIGQNKYWIYSQHNDWDVPKTIGGFIFSFGTDTIINSIRYTKLIKHDLDGEHLCQFPPCFTPYIPYQINTNFQKAFAYLREYTISKRVYCLPAIDFDKYCDKSDHVLYEFDQKVGDTLSKCNLLIHSGWPISERYFKIDSIKSEYIFNKNRKVSYFEGFVYGGLPFIRNLKQIEGIGIENNLGFYIDNTAVFVSFCEGTLEQCNIISSTQDKSSKSQRPIQIIPNPSNDLVSFHLNNATRQHVNQYLIRDLQGKMVKDKSPINESSESTISTLEFSSGMYIIQFLKDGQLVDVQKLVISH